MQQLRLGSAITPEVSACLAPPSCYPPVFVMSNFPRAIDDELTRNVPFLARKVRRCLINHLSHRLQIDEIRTVLILPCLAGDLQVVFHEVRVAAKIAPSVTILYNFPHHPATG